MSKNKTQADEIENDFTDEAEDMKDSNNLSFDDLLPKSDLTFTLEDGSVVPFKVRETMNRDDFATVAQSQKRMTRYFEQVQKDPRDEAAKKNLERCAEQFIKVILPDMPSETLSKLVLGQKTKIIEFWGKHTKEDDEGEKPKN